MLRNYLLIALRNTWRKKGYAFINITGLAIALSCFLVILLFVRYELSYDRFLPNSDNIYRITVHGKVPQTRTPHPMAQAMVRDFPEVVSAVSLSPIWGPGLTRQTFSVRYEDIRFEERSVLSVDSTFFEVFPFRILQGDGQRALREPLQVILTKDMARKYFGDQEAVGKRLIVNEDTEVTVGAVVEDVPSNAHFHFDMLVSYVTLKTGDTGQYYEWADFGHYNYIVLRPGVDARSVQARIPSWIGKYIPVTPEMREEIRQYDPIIRLQPIKDIHLHSHLTWELESNGHIAYIYILSAAALFILLIACVNFMNLATARSADRMREIGVRKALGARRGQLAIQFIGESMLYSLFAMVIALALLQVTLPWMNGLLNMNLNLEIINIDLIVLVLGICLLVGFLAGSYPAFLLSSYRPALILRSGQKTGSGGLLLRKGLVVFQFALSAVLIISTIVVYQQIDYLRNRPLGFNDEQIVVVPLKTSEARRHYEAIKDELKKHADIHSATAVSNVPGGFFNQNNLQWRASDDLVLSNELRVDYDFFETMGVEIIKGRTFSKSHPADERGAFILNQTAAAMFDWEDPIGEELSWLDETVTWQGEVIGIMKDFHFQSLHNRVAPLAIQVLPGAFSNMLIKIQTERVPQTLEYIKNVWASFEPTHGFEYSFLSQDFAALYRAEENLAIVISALAMLTIFVACMGLFALAAFTAEKRTKEIGIRKVLGASVPGIVALLSKEFLSLIGLSILMVIPVGYFVMSRWLEDFAYHITLGPMIFLQAGVVVLIIALFTVSYQAFRAAISNPINSLRYE